MHIAFTAVTAAILQTPIDAPLAQLESEASLRLHVPNQTFPHTSEESFQSPSGPACQSAPDGSPASVVICYDNACKAYRDEFNNCPDADCRAAAAAEYTLAINACLEQISSDSWVIIWYRGDEFGVSYEFDIPDGARAFLF